MPLKPNQVLTITFPSLIAASIGLPAIAQSSLTVEEPSNAAISALGGIEDGNIIWGQPDSTTGSIPPEVWVVMQSQTDSSSNLLGSYADLFRGGVQPEDVWGIAQSQLELPGAVEQILSGSSSSPGSIPTDVWDVMRSQVGLPGSYGGESFGSLEQILSGENSPFDFSSVITRDDWGVSSFLNGSPAVTNSPAASNSDSADAWNPFRQLSHWIQNTPLARAMGTWRNRIRERLNSSSFGFFTRNQVVKERDQANLFDQEIARMMAEPQLGESGEQWMQAGAQDAMSVLGSGIQSASTAVQIAQDAQALTSTQDVAKAVAQQGGQNATLSAALLQMQTQNQASLLQLQQLTSSAIQLSANNSEGIDEANRRERAERSNALRQSASEFIYIPNVFD